jgi:recombination protein RecA
VFGEGISRAGDLVDMGVAGNIIEKSGAWYSYNNDRIGQGRENTKLFLKEHPDMLREIEEKIYAKAGIALKADDTLQKSKLKDGK